MIIQNITIGDKIGLLREQRGITWRKFQKLAGMHAGSIRTIVAGNVVNPGIFTLGRILKALGMSLADFMAGYDYELRLFPEYEIGVMSDERINRI